MPDDLQFTALPREDVPMSATFDIAEWDGKVEHQIPKLRNLVRQQIPLVWKNGVNWCEGRKFPNLSNGTFSEIVDDFLKPENLQFPHLCLEAKSAKLGEVTNSTNHSFFSQLKKVTPLRPSYSPDSVTWFSIIRVSMVKWSRFSPCCLS